MRKELELWRFIAERLEQKQNVMLLVVAESSGSSPGRQGYKMAISSGGELIGSIGGGVMEVNLVEQSRAILSRIEHATLTAELIDQVHRTNVPDSSGMICSGKQTVICMLLRASDAKATRSTIDALKKNRRDKLNLSAKSFTVARSNDNEPQDGFKFEKVSETEFVYTERLGVKNDLCIIGGGHCALALSDLMSKMDFFVSLFDDRPKLNTIEKNKFADRIEIIDSYETIARHIRSGANTYVVVMTLGYKSDAAVIRGLIENEFKYFGVLGSKAKMAMLFRELKDEGFPAEKLDRIHTPIGLHINSRTPEEIAVSIAAEIILVKNAYDNRSS
ncbi:MAG: XdhC family protein [Pyrinomonadaceae bacterium]